MKAFDKLHIVRCENSGYCGSKVQPMNVWRQALWSVEPAINECRVRDQRRLGIGDQCSGPEMPGVLPSRCLFLVVAKTNSAELAIEYGQQAFAIRPFGMIQQDRALETLPHDRPVLVYDGDCGFCNGAVQFVLAHQERHDLLFVKRASQLGMVIRRHFALEA